MIEFDYAFATDTLGDPNKKISMMVATQFMDQVLLLWQGEIGGQDDYVMQSFQNYIDRLGLVKAELRCPGAMPS